MSFCFRALLMTVCFGASGLQGVQAENKQSKRDAIRSIKEQVQCGRLIGWSYTNGHKYACGLIMTENPRDDEYVNFQLVVQDPYRRFTVGLFADGTEELLDFEIEPEGIFARIRVTDPRHGLAPAEKFMSLTKSRETGELVGATFYDSRKEGTIFPPGATCEFYGTRCD